MCKYLVFNNKVDMFFHNVCIWNLFQLWTLDDTPDDDTGSAETYVGTENTKTM